MTRSTGSERLRWLLVFFVFVIASLWAAIFLEVIRLPLGLVGADITMSAQIVSGRLTISGLTSVADGGIVECDVWHESEQKESGTGVYSLAKSVAVSSGQFQCDFDVLGWPPGRVTADVQFRPFSPDQPEHIGVVYGPDGQRLDGANVMHDSDGWIVDVRSDVVIQQRA